MAVGESEKAKQLFVQVPKGSIPGTTQLRVDDDSNKDLIVTVPTEASPDDVLVLTKMENQDTGWQLGIVPAASAAELGLAPAAQGSGTQADQTSGEDKIQLYVVPVDPIRSYERVVEAARLNGAYVNPKLRRAVIPPTGMVGMIAAEPIEKGEEITRLPASLHINVETLPLMMPELFNKVNASHGFQPSFHKDICVAACVTKLLAEAVGRLRQGVAVVPQGDLGSLWSIYIDQLLGENFENHPYWRWVSDGQQTLADVLPSPEGWHAEHMASDILRTFKIIKMDVPEDVRGEGYNAGLFLHARLSMLSRVFHTTPAYSSLVPLTDLFNHSPDPTCDWVFDKEADAMVLTSNRAHAVGEQLWITYGMRANPILFRTYGFTLPPHLEPCWSYILQLNKPNDIYEKYLPEEHLGFTLGLDSRLVQVTLIDALNACAAGGHRADEFLMSLCSRLLEEYEQDEMLQPSLAALRRARAKSPRSASWWEELDPSSDAASSAWREACINCKMSEYLCLQAHMEICDLFAGRVKEEQCLEGASTVRSLLVEAFDQLRQFGRFKLVTAPVTQ